MQKVGLSRSADFVLRSSSTTTTTSSSSSHTSTSETTTTQTSTTISTAPLHQRAKVADNSNHVHHPNSSSVSVEIVTAQSYLRAPIEDTGQTCLDTSQGNNNQDHNDLHLHGPAWKLSSSPVR